MDDVKNLWVLKYAPKTLDDMIVSEENKKQLKSVIEKVPNTLITGPPGTGKSTFVDILIKETGAESLKINASMTTGIDFIREQVVSFARSFSPGKLKIVYVNESERLSTNATDSLKDLMESVYKICRFVFVSNSSTLKNDKDGAITSRCGAHIVLNDPPAKEIFKRCTEILNKEGVKLKNKEALIKLIKKKYPDVRGIIGILQSNSYDGVIDDIQFSSTEDLHSKLFELMNKQDIEGLRKTLKSNYVNYDELYKYLYTLAIDDDSVELKNIGEFLIDIGEYMYRNSLVAIPEVNFMSFYFNCLKKEVF